MTAMVDKKMSWKECFGCALKKPITEFKRIGVTRKFSLFCKKCARKDR